MTTIMDLDFRHVFALINIIILSIMYIIYDCSHTNIYAARSTFEEINRACLLVHIHIICLATTAEGVWRKMK